MSAGENDWGRNAVKLIRKDASSCPINVIENSVYPLLSR